MKLVIIITFVALAAVCIAKPQFKPEAPQQTYSKKDLLASEKSPLPVTLDDSGAKKLEPALDSKPAFSHTATTAPKNQPSSALDSNPILNKADPQAPAPTSATKTLNKDDPQALAPTSETKTLNKGDPQAPASISATKTLNKDDPQAPAPYSASNTPNKPPTLSPSREFSPDSASKPGPTQSTASAFKKPDPVPISKSMTGQGSDKKKATISTKLSQVNSKKAAPVQSQQAPVSTKKSTFTPSKSSQVSVKKPASVHSKPTQASGKRY